MVDFSSIKGYIFDMDGTLIDSMGMWRDSGDLYLQRHHIPKIKEFPLVQCGKEYNALTKEFMEFYGIEKEFLEVKREFETMVSPFYLQTLQLKEGVRDFLIRLKREGKKMCVATATQSSLAVPCLKRLGVADFFTIILSTKDIGINKYYPDVYLKCCEAMGTLPSETAVFEDALYAAKTALSAGFQVIGIHDPIFEEDFSEISKVCHHAIKNYQEL